MGFLLQNTNPLQKSINNGYKFLESLNHSICSKSRWFSSWKRGLIIDDLIEAKKQLNSMLNEDHFGAASSTVVIEEFLDG